MSDVFEAVQNGLKNCEKGYSSNAGFLRLNQWRYSPGFLQRIKTLRMFARLHIAQILRFAQDDRLRVVVILNEVKDLYMSATIFPAVWCNLELLTEGL